MAVDMAVDAPAPKFTFTERAAKHNLSNAELLNSNNAGGPEPPKDSDILVAGGGIHGLIYAIHAATKEGNTRSISLIEKADKPAYKIGESTLPPFAMWAKMFGLTADYLLRIFGLKDGLAFYYMDENSDRYYSDLTIGPPPQHLSGYQLERSISELLFTLLAQRRGVNVYHGHKVDFNACKVQGGVRNSTINVGKATKGSTEPPTDIKSSMLVDATGRFRQYTSKAGETLKRFPGYNTDAFWAYYTHPKDIEERSPFKGWESNHTNHLCTPDGWFWIIPIISWEGNPLGKLMDMLSYLLDCAEMCVPSDKLPSTDKLAEMFGLEYQWCTSIGIAARNDVKYPENLADYGVTEGERKLNYFIRKYPLINEFMSNYDLIKDLYGPNTTWFVRKTLAYQSPVVSGPGWMAIGDACGFTNPLYSPGINVGMASSTFGADTTLNALDAAESQSDVAKAEMAIRQVYEPYDKFVTALIPDLWKMNKFQYTCFRDARLGPTVAVPWQYFATAMVSWDVLHVGEQNFTVDRESWIKLTTNWACGSHHPRFDAVARETIRLIDPYPLDQKVPDEVVNQVIAFAEKTFAEALADDPSRVFRWAAKIRSRGNDMKYVEGKTGRDHYCNKCEKCKVWTIRRPDWTVCHSCGTERTAKENTIVWDPPMQMAAA